MLGRYNAQGLGDAVENLTREFVVSDGTYTLIFPKLYLLVDWVIYRVDTLV